LEGGVRVSRYAITWGDLSAIEPTLEEARAHVRALAIAYNDPRNAPLLGHTAQLSEAEVIEVYETMMAKGGRPFLLFREDRFYGDGDLRGIRGSGGNAEFAFLIASPDAQGKGLGTKFATMIHALGFARLGLTRIYATVVPQNVASRRVFEKLGYTEDTSPAAREYGDAGDVVLSVDRATFQAVAARALADIQIAVR
jgi:RimJ/RimL family protein N-acetyltransferase